MTQKKLEQLVRKWQKILRLQDWEIEVKQVGHNDFLEDGRCAQLEASANQKEGTIKILKPDQYRAWNDKPQDIEQDVVHEQAHVYLFAIERYARAGEEEALKVAIENAANIFSAALIMLDRKTQRRT